MHSNVWGWTEVLSKEELLSANISFLAYFTNNIGDSSFNYDQILDSIKALL